MSEWRVAPLHEIADIRVSNVDKKSTPGETPVRLCNYMDVYANDYIRADLPFMEATATAAEIQRFGVQQGDVMITKDSETPDDIGIPAVAMDQIEGLVCGYHLAQIRPNRALVDPVYLAKHLALPETAAYFAQRAAGSTRYGLSNGTIADVPIRLAPLGQQQRVAEILGRLDDAIERTEAVILKHEQVKAGLSYDLFTRGALSEGGLRPLMSDAPHLYRDGPAGVLPIEWEVATAASLCSLITKGTTPASTDMWEGDEGIRFLRVDNLTFDGRLSFEASEFRISAHTHASTLARSRCVAGDVLMNIVGPPLGKVGIVSTDSGSININQAISVFRPAGRVLSHYLLLWLTTETAKRWILQRAKQTSGQVNVTLAMCQALPVPLPPLEEQGRIVDCISASNNTLLSLRRRLEKLCAQKLGLMQDLLTDKVRVPLSETVAA